MIKYKTNDSKKQKLQQLRNMTWDLFIMNHYFRIWQNKKENEEILMASDDKVLNGLLKIGIRIQKKESFDEIKQYVDGDDFKTVTQSFEVFDKLDDRMYLSNDWTPEYRKKLILEYEADLL
jgi:hypothetical protein